MITKQQALEFLYELSNSFSINMDLTKGIDCYINVYSDSCGTFGVEGDFNSLEEATTEFIKRFGNTALLEDLKCLVPVDIDMLEVGQLYKVEFLDFTGVLNSFTEKLLSITEEDKTVFNFSNGYYTKYTDIKEIYKVNKCK